jgi:hypothetical protein
MDDAMIMPRDHAQAYALTFPGAYAEHPWGQTVIKVKRKVFVFVNGAIAPEAGVSGGHNSADCPGQSDPRSPRG